jgi:hypothetical protein
MTTVGRGRVWVNMPSQPSVRKKSKSVDDLLDDVDLLLAGVRRFSQVRTRRTLVREARLLLNQIDDKLLGSAPVVRPRPMQDVEPSSELHEHVLSS